MVNEAQVLPGIAAAAVASEGATGCPALLSAAQCILESDWLQRCPGNNPFGIKAEEGKPVVSVWTHEYVNGERVLQQLHFRSYDSLEEAFADHARLLQQAAPYQAAWAEYQAAIKAAEEALAKGIAARYATAPNYAAELVAVMRQANVVAAVKSARSPAPPASPVSDLTPPPATRAA